MAGLLGVERNIGLSVEVRDAVDVNDTFLLSEEAGENGGAAAAEESFNFEESFLAGDSMAASGESLFEGLFCHHGGIEFDGDGLWSDLEDLGSFYRIESGLDLSRDAHFVQPVRE